MFDVNRNSANVLYDDASVVNRTKLLILSDTTAMYNDPEFGVGIKKYMWQYNTPNVRAMLKDRIKLQLLKYEPCVESDKTEFVDELLFTESESNSPDKLEMTVGLHTTYQTDVTVQPNFN